MNDDLITLLQKKVAELEASVKMLRQTGKDAALAERDYKVALRTEALKMRDAGTAVGMITLTIYGVPSVADLRLKRDIAQTLYDANKEHINATKLEMRIIEEQIKREWGTDLST